MAKIFATSTLAGSICRQTGRNVREVETTHRRNAARDGHAFGLPHCTDDLYIMTRGFDRLNRVFTLVEPRSQHNREPIVFAEKDAVAVGVFLEHTKKFRSSLSNHSCSKTPRTSTSNSRFDFGVALSPSTIRQTLDHS